MDLYESVLQGPYHKRNLLLILVIVLTVWGLGAKQAFFLFQVNNLCNCVWIS